MDNDQMTMMMMMMVGTLQEMVENQSHVEEKSIASGLKTHMRWQLILQIAKSNTHTIPILYKISIILIYKNLPKYSTAYTIFVLHIL